MTPAEKECLKQWPYYLEMDRQDQAYVHTCMEQFSKGANWQKEQDNEILKALQNLCNAVKNLAIVETTITEESIPEAHTKVLRARIAADHIIIKHS